MAEKSSAIEQFGIQPIPKELRTVSRFDLFSIILNFLVNPGMILIGGEAVVLGGLSLWGAFWAEVLGILGAFAIYTIMATVGVDYGIPGQVATRSMFGIRGSKVLSSFFRSAASIFWFAFQTLSASLGIAALLHNLFHVQVSLILVSFIFAILQAFIAIVGYDSLKVLSRFSFVYKIVILVLAIVLMLSFRGHGFNVSAAFHYTGHATHVYIEIAVWINSVFAAWLSMVTDAADFCRYSSSRRDMWWATMGGALIGTALSAFLGAFGAALSGGKQENVFAVLPAMYHNGIFIVALILMLVFDNWTINVLNLYTGGLSLANMFAKLGRVRATLIASILGIAISVIPALINNFTGVMSGMGNVFAPIAGILVGDYLVMKRANLDVPALYDPHGRYWFTGGFNPVAVLWMVLGFGFYYIVPASWIPNVATIVVVGICYVLTSYLVRDWIPGQKAAMESHMPEPTNIEAVEIQL